MLRTSALSLSLSSVITFPAAWSKGSALAVNIFVKVFLDLFYCSGQSEFKLGFCFSNSLSAYLSKFLVIAPSSLSLLPEYVDPLFWPESQQKFPVHPCLLLKCLLRGKYSVLCWYFFITSSIFLRVNNFLCETKIKDCTEWLAGITIDFLSSIIFFLLQLHWLLQYLYQDWKGSRILGKRKYAIFEHYIYSCITGYINSEDISISYIDIFKEPPTKDSNNIKFICIIQELQKTPYSLSLITTGTSFLLILSRFL